MQRRGLNYLEKKRLQIYLKEYNQLDDVPMSITLVVAPFNPNRLTPLYRKKTLEAVNLIKEKLCGNIKVSTCANGRKQRKYLKPDDIVYSPTFSTKSLMKTLVLDIM